MTDHTVFTQSRPMGMSGTTLVITIDRLPAWILPCYGSAWVAMPAVDALAGRGLVLDNAFAVDANPRRTVDDLLGGARRAVAARGGRIAIITDDDTVVSAEAADDLTIIAVRPSVHTAADEAATALAKLFEAAVEVVRTGHHDLVWCHAGSLGRTWDAPDSFRDAYIDPEDPPPPSGAAVPMFTVDRDTDPDLLVGLRQVYAGQLTLLDRCLAPLLDAASPDATVLWAGIRGMPLGLHDRMGPGPMLPYSEVVRLPVILVDSRGRMAAQRYGGLVTPGDVGATLASLVGGCDPAVANDTESPWEPRSLENLLATWTSRDRDRVIVSEPDAAAVITRSWHFIQRRGEDDDAVMLFAKPDDAFERCDVADRCPGVVEALVPVAKPALAGDLTEAWRRPLGEAGREP